MKYAVCLVFTLFVSFAGPVLAQEKTVRETYRKLETYNAAAQVLENERTRRPFRPEASVKFELSDFRSGSVQEILNKPYAELVTLPTGEQLTFPIDGFSKACLLQGTDELGYLLSFEDRIAAFEANGA